MPDRRVRQDQLQPQAKSQGKEIKALRNFQASVAMEMRPCLFWDFTQPRLVVF